KLLFHPIGVPAREAAEFAEAFFLAFMATQMGLVFLLTPVLTAGAIAEEKQRRTLDGLLTTHLRDREIILGKLVSRLAQMALLLLAGLPVLGFMQLLGGVDPQLVMAGFGLTLLTMLSLASLGIFNSARLGRPRPAIFMTYLYAGLFLACSYVCSCCIPG